MKKLNEFFKIITEEHNFINLFWTNFHKVDEGVYRSAQLTPWKLKKIIKKYNIKTIINLRGNKKNYLYEKEKEICEKMGVKYISFSIASRSLPKPEEIEKLVEFFKNEQKPMLFHCKAGADRTGFVATLYHIINGKNKKDAIKRELKLKYGYLSLSKAGRIKKLFEEYNEKEDFLLWVRKNQKRIENTTFKANPLVDFIFEKILRRE